MGRRGKKHKANRLKKQQGLCVYCGAVGKVEHEDVIPVCLFLKPVPDRVLVPSCRKCNLAKSKDDSYLRDMLVADYRCFANPTAQTIFNGPVLRSIRTNRSAIARTFRSDGELVPMLTHSGVYLGHMPGVSLEEARILRIFSTIVRGLNFKVRRQRLADNTVFTVERLGGPSSQENIEQLRQVAWSGTGRIGTGILECGYMFDEEPNTTVWLLIFYSRIYILVTTTSPEAVPTREFPR